MTINEYLRMTTEVITTKTGYSFQAIRPRIVCVDGFDVSIQAGGTMYCSPRLDGLHCYESVEIGYPSDVVPEWMEYVGDADDPLETVYIFVPVEIVDAVLEQHGGIANGVYS